MIWRNGVAGATLSPMNDDESRKLNSIVGAAIKALAESGAEDEFVGSFAASHRLKVAKILGQSEQIAESPDLLAIVTQALDAALGKAGIVPGPVRKAKPAKRVIVYVGGQRTSITLHQESIDKLRQVVGDNDKADAVIQELANAAPAGRRQRSKWVREHMASYVMMEAPGSASRH